MYQVLDEGTMINQLPVEALHSATYVENYLDSVENLPDDVQRHLSRIREIDVLYRNHLRDVSVSYEQWLSASANASAGSAGSGNASGPVQNGTGGAGSDSSSATAEPTSSSSGNPATKRAMARMQKSLIAAQELGDEKLQVVQHLQDLIDHKTRQLDQDYKNLGSDFFVRLDFGREEKITEGQQKEIRPNSPGSACSPNNANSSPAAAYSVSTGNGTSTGGSVHVSAGNIGGTANSGSGNYSSNGNSSGSGNGNGNGGGSSGGPGSTGSGTGNGGGGAGSDRGSKRARRTRNDQNSGSANGSSTPNSTSGAPMDVDPIDTSNIKQEPGTSGLGIGGGNGGSSSGGGSGMGSSGAGAGGMGTSKGNSGQASGASGQGKKGGANAGKKKKRKTGRGQAREAREDTPPPEETIDPDEPTYCLCDQISFGEMILCDNDLCPIEWFHFSCVALMSKPKGKWFCPNCRGDRPNVMKPKAQFLKELERYNKEKEEKT
ncbi:inhibitor of growth protein 1 [Uranotaenia lowii]|uniref:inhibitor of growth protein 1 n=1 Tax=Uranotaenia lowii TaxID=190385 RepID=UPI002478BA8F|nr:inhibitor of growth protein 1 [Uranotaenia lowii]